MKRIHLFEFEDLSWFPGWLRELMTRFLVAMHKILGSSGELAELVARALAHANEPHILDLCSGSGGPMPDVVEKLKSEHGIVDLSLTFSDLYPNMKAAKIINDMGDPDFSYLTSPLNAVNDDGRINGVRTLVCSLHHMKPDIAYKILRNAKNSHQPICVFEISDNSFPIWIWWIAIPVNILLTLIVTPFIKPMSWQQIVFTYLIPILPLCIAWDGAVSNARTYTLKDMDILLKDLYSESYLWEKGLIKNRVRKLYLLGLPKI